MSRQPTHARIKHFIIKKKDAYKPIKSLKIFDLNKIFGWRFCEWFRSVPLPCCANSTSVPAHHSRVDKHLNSLGYCSLCTSSLDAPLMQTQHIKEHLSASLGKVVQSMSHSLPQAQTLEVLFSGVAGVARENRPAYGPLWNYLFWVVLHWNGTIGIAPIDKLMVLSPKIDAT